MKIKKITKVRSHTDSLQYRQKMKIKDIIEWFILCGDDDEDITSLIERINKHK